MAFIQFLPLLIMVLLVVATISLFIFWLGRPTKKKLTMARLSLGYLFLLNALLALTVNVMLMQDASSIDSGPLSLLMLLLPLGVGVLLYRGGCRRHAQMSVEEAIQFEGGQAQTGKWRILESGDSEEDGQARHAQGEAVLKEMGKSAPSGTWPMILLLVSALAYAPAIFMLQGSEGDNDSPKTVLPQTEKERIPSPLEEGASQ